MVEFKKLLGKSRLTKPIDPIEIFNNLDKESGKEYLRPPQKSVLKEWHEGFRDKKDLIIKLHTGQGKTLIGLLILQSSINEGQGPAMYVCPNNYLVDQTIEQARSFGLKTIKFDDSKPPSKFLNSEAILVANCKRLFNGKSVFGVRGSGRETVNIGAIVIDDAHKCLDIIRDSFSITINRVYEGVENPVYNDLWKVFEESLKRQAPGTCSDITNHVDCLLAVPFWTWFDKRDEVLNILSKYRDSEGLLFVWDLLKDHIDECVCIFSGNKLEITPRLLPVDLIPSFTDAKRRIFLSATLTEDAFLVKDLGIEPDSVTNPLSSRDIKYSGERLIIIPSLVDPNLRREQIISWVQALAAKHGDFGVVAITPSFYHANEWKSGGAEIAGISDLYEMIEDLKVKVKNKKANRVLILVNEYDGVDLPDSTCRILTLDSLPSHHTLMDRYLHEMRPHSGITRRKLAQRAEQGMGRAIRGSSDWCIVIIFGVKFSNFLSETSKRAFLSKEAQMQIKIADELSQEMKTEGGHLKVMEKLVNQCLTRDEGWKEYYRTRMSELEPDEPRREHLDRALLERRAEMLYRQGQYQKAAESLQPFIDLADIYEKGWLLQLKSTYLYPIDRTRSMDTQVRAFSENPLLSRPEIGIVYSKLSIKGSRASRILDWIKNHESYNALIVELNEIMDRLLFGSPSESFEEAISDIGQSLGFVAQRPEKTTGRGPDNLWNIHGKTYWIIECKNNVSSSRTEISKDEAGQLSNAIGWFKEYYEGERGLPVLVHPAKKLALDAFLAEPFWIIGKDELKKLKENTTRFYTSLQTSSSFEGLSIDIITQKLKEHNLDTDNLEKEYLQRSEPKKQTK